jgi:dTDP-4-dehydrorhamnose 3,5-epimerase
MSRFVFTDLPLAGLKLVERQSVGDSRGFLSRLFCAEELASAGWLKPIVQINHTVTSKRGTVRGMHFQLPPHAEMKLVSCLRGRIWDVAVDLRRGSETLLCWHAEELSAQNHKALLVPEGFAHGYQALTDDVELLYCHSVAFNDGAQRGLNPRDLKLAIEWPLDFTELSDRDARLPMIGHGFEGFAV